MPCCDVRLVAEKPRLVVPVEELATIGDLLRVERLNRNLTQREVAEAWGVSMWSILLWEANRVSPTIRHRRKIYTFLGYDPSPRPKSLGGRIISARRRLGITQEELAKRLEVSPCSVSRWERDEGRPISKLRAGLVVLLEDAEAMEWEPRD